MFTRPRAAVCNVAYQQMCGALLPRRERQRPRRNGRDTAELASPLRRVIASRPRTLRSCAAARRARTGSSWKHAVQLPEIAVIKEPANHARWHLAFALLVKPMPGRELRPPIGAGQRGLQ